MVANSKCKSMFTGPEIMLITDDRTFFEVFVSSPTAEHSAVAGQVVLKLHSDTLRYQHLAPPIRVKLAVPGM